MPKFLCQAHYDLTFNVILNGKNNKFIFIRFRIKKRFNENCCTKTKTYLLRKSAKNFSNASKKNEINYQILFSGIYLKEKLILFIVKDLFTKSGERKNNG